MLLDIWGRGAMSLGTTAVERAWWPDHVRNMNRTCALGNLGMEAVSGRGRLEAGCDSNLAEG